MTKIQNIFFLIFISNFITKSENQIVYTKDLQDWDEDGKYEQKLLFYLGVNLLHENLQLS